MTMWVIPGSERRQNRGTVWLARIILGNELTGRFPVG